MFWRKSSLEGAVEEAVRSALRQYVSIATDEIGKLSKVSALSDEITKLRDQLADLKTQRKQEEREIEHKLGLHKLRTEAEKQMADQGYAALEARLKKDGEVTVREAKVVAREEAMKRADELLGEQVSRMERLVDMLVQALPTAAMFKET